MRNNSSDGSRARSVCLTRAKTNNRYQRRGTRPQPESTAELRTTVHLREHTGEAAEFRAEAVEAGGVCGCASGRLACGTAILGLEEGQGRHRVCYHRPGTVEAEGHQQNQEAELNGTLDMKFCIRPVLGPLWRMKFMNDDKSSP